MKMTVFYDGQFWVGVVEMEANGLLKARKIVFGPEPMDGEILDFVKHKLLSLLEKNTHGIKIINKLERRVNPKRRARQVAKEMASKGTSTMAQEAIKEELENRKKEKLILLRENKELIKEQKRELARKKAKEKHRGKK